MKKMGSSQDLMDYLTLQIDYPGGPRLSERGQCGCVQTGRTVWWSRQTIHVVSELIVEID